METFDSKTPSPLTIAVLVLATALDVVACGSDRNEFREGRPTSPLLSKEGDGPSDCQANLRCSHDLKQVLRVHCDGTEEVATECGPDLGCGGGACVDPCTSAALSKGSIGCSFATLPPDDVIDPGVQGSCFVAMITNVWDRPVRVDATLGADPIDIGPSTYYAEWNGGMLDYIHVDGAIAPGKVALVFLAESSVQSQNFVRCPATVVPALREDPIRHNTARTRAFRFTTDAPVSAYSIWPYGGGKAYFTAATLLLPISSWDTNYLAVSTWVLQPNPGEPFIQIVAAEDDTEVRMRTNVNIVGGAGVAGIAPGETRTWTIARGEVLQIKQAADTSGSPIEASKPIGLFGGADCAYIPYNREACDATQAQIPALSQWGSSYALVPYRPRVDWGVGTTSARESVPWRIVGAANATKLTYDPARPVGAPETLDAGQVVDFMSKDLVTVRSQDNEHPFYAGMFMTGGTTRDVIDQRGDPEFVNVVPSEQFLDRYIFFVDYTYPDTTLTLVRRKTATGFRPVTLECAGEITDWKPLGKDGEYEFAWLYVTKDGAEQEFAGGMCGYGRHEAYSDGPFAVYVWGISSYCSYGYAGGQGSRLLHNVKGPPVN